jgi:hypothetical protein
MSTEITPATATAGTTPPAAAAPAPWAQIASEAAAARDEVATVLAEGMRVPDVLDSIARVTSTLSWIQAHIASGPAAPTDEHALDAVRAARRSIGEARGLVSRALASCTVPSVAPGSATH